MSLLGMHPQSFMRLLLWSYFPCYQKLFRLHSQLQIRFRAFCFVWSPILFTYAAELKLATVSS